MSNTAKLAVALGILYVAGQAGAQNTAVGGIVLPSPSPSSPPSTVVSMPATKAEYIKQVEAIRADYVNLMKQRNELRRWSQEEEEKKTLQYRQSGLKKSGYDTIPEYASNKERIAELDDILRQRVAIANQNNERIASLQRQEQQLIAYARRQRWV